MLLAAVPCASVSCTMWTGAGGCGKALDAGMHQLGHTRCNSNPCMRLGWLRDNQDGRCRRQGIITGERGCREELLLALKKALARVLRLFSGTPRGGVLLKVRPHRDEEGSNAHLWGESVLGARVFQRFLSC